jgi:adenylate cyclase
MSAMPPARARRSPPWALLRAPLAQVALAALAVFAAVAGLRALGVFELLELPVYDLLVRRRMEPDAGALPVTIVRIREADHERYGFPLDDETLARALEHLLAAGPRAIGIDLYRNLPEPPGTETLRKVWRASPRIVGLLKFGEGDEVVHPPPGLPPEQVGFSDFPVDRGGILRRALLYMADPSGRQHPSFALRLAETYLAGEGVRTGPAGPDAPACIRLGAARLCPLEGDHGAYANVDAAGFQVLLEYTHDPASLRSLTVEEVIERRFPEDAVRDRVVIVGTTAAGAKDTFFTPVSERLIEAAEPTFGVELHGLVVGQLVEQARGVRAPLRALAEGGEWLLLLAASVLGGLVAMRARSAAVFVAGALGGVAAIGAASSLLFGQGWWVPPVAPIVAWTGAASLVALPLALAERREKQVVRDLFEGMLGKEVFAEIWRQREEFLIHGSLRPSLVVLTVLMSDLEGFTDASERMQPVALMNWIDEYMRRMAQIVREHDGVVDDYAGDGLKADFGIPPRASNEEINRDAVNAVRAALSMVRALEELNARWKAQDLPTGRLRIGIHTGSAVVGSMGAGSRVKYTSIGSMVNTASRLESVDKESFAAERESAARIVISEATLRCLGGRFETTLLGEHRLKGQDRQWRLYRVLAEKPAHAREEGP